MGRTGKLFAYEWAGTPRRTSCAWPRRWAAASRSAPAWPRAEAAKGMTVGTHGSTYGGNPLAMAVGLAAFDEIAKPETLAHVREVAGYFGQQLHGPEGPLSRT